MKKIIKVLCFLIVINLLIFCNLLIKVYNNNILLHVSYAKTSLNNNDKLILSILKDTNKNNLIEYIDYINLKVIDLLPNDKKNNTYFILSLPENVSFIAIYKKIDSGNYKYLYTIDNLSSIDNLYIYKNFLIIEQSTPNISSEFSNNKYFQIFTLKNNVYTSVFKKNIYSEKIIVNNNSTFREIEKSSIDCLDGEVPRILCVKTVTKYQKSYISDSENSFLELSKVTQKETYQWNFKNQEFNILKTEIIE